LRRLFAFFGVNECNRDLTTTILKNVADPTPVHKPTLLVDCNCRQTLIFNLKF
jgi:hypothetical protein